MSAEPSAVTAYAEKSGASPSYSIRIQQKGP